MGLASIHLTLSGLIALFNSQFRLVLLHFFSKKKKDIKLLSRPLELRMETARDHGSNSVSGYTLMGIKVVSYP